MAVLLPFALTLLGVLLLCCTGRRQLSTPTVALAAPGIGFAVASCAFYGWRIVGGTSGTFPPFFALFTLITLAALFLSWRRQAGGSVQVSVTRGHRGVFYCGLAALVAASAVALWIFQLYRQTAPFGQYDATAIWNVRALLLWRADEPLAGIFANLRHGHPSYPLYLPAGLAAQFALLGGDDVLTPAVQSLIFTAAAAAAIWAGLKLLGAGRYGPLAAALFLVTPRVQHWGFSQCADIPLAYLLAATAVGLAAQLRSQTRAHFPGWLAGLLLGLLPWTKNEGLLLAILLFGAWLAARRAVASEQRPPLGAILLGTLPGLVSLATFKLLWAPRDELSMFATGAVTRALDPERWQIVGTAFWQELNPWTGAQEWGLIWPAIALVGLLGWRSYAHLPEFRFLALAVLLSFAAWFGVYLGTVHDPTWHLRTSLDRLLLQLLPLTLIAVFSAVEYRTYPSDPTSRSGASS